MKPITKRIEGDYEANLQNAEGSLLINVTHPHKQQVYFTRITDHNMQDHLKQIAENAKELYEYICDLQGEKMSINGNNELALEVAVGKKVKTYAISLQKVEISSEEVYKKKVQDLQKQLEKKEFEVQFYREQYLYLLQHLQLKPNVEELQRIYMRSVPELAGDKYSKMNKSHSMFQKEELDTSVSAISAKSAKVGGSSSFIKQKEVLKCPKLHFLANQPTQHAFYKCNICRQMIKAGDLRYHCRPCDFDACSNCIATPPQNRKYCPKQHAMNFGTAPNYLVRSCDMCKKSVAFSKAYTCLECDYDACEKCIK